MKREKNLPSATVGWLCSQSISYRNELLNQTVCECGTKGARARHPNTSRCLVASSRRDDFFMVYSDSVACHHTLEM